MHYIMKDQHSLQQIKQLMKEFCRQTQNQENVITRSGQVRKNNRQAILFLEHYDINQVENLHHWSQNQCY